MVFAIFKKENQSTNLKWLLRINIFLIKIFKIEIAFQTTSVWKEPLKIAFECNYLFLCLCFIMVVSKLVNEASSENIERQFLHLNLEYSRVIFVLK